MNGTEVAKNIRNSTKNKKTRVVALTAHVDDGVERDCFTAGINQVVSKPIDLIGLKSIVKEAKKKEIS
jgi:CheY-like chemotaxis protein